LTIPAPVSLLVWLLVALIEGSFVGEVLQTCLASGCGLPSNPVAGLLLLVPVLAFVYLCTNCYALPTYLPARGSNAGWREC
jgi:hypothetical protein